MLYTFRMLMSSVTSATTTVAKAAQAQLHDHLHQSTVVCPQMLPIVVDLLFFWLLRRE